MTAGLLAFTTTAKADTVPAPGGAPGTHTGDTARPFTGLAAPPGADIFTGTATTSVDVVVPPGRAGMTPALSVAYSSAAGASPYGYGWNLSLPRIERSTRHGVPSYDSGDTFLAHFGGAVLELNADPDQPGRYLPRVEAAYARTGFDASANAWVVIDRSGNTYRFGERRGDRIAVAETAEGTFAWLLTSMEDSQGNLMEVNYLGAQEGTAGTGLPTRITYGANTKAATPHFAEIRFQWDAAEHPRTSLRSGILQRFDVELAAIETSSEGLPARRYDFHLERDAATGAVLLRSVGLVAFGEHADLDVQVPETVFLYTPSRGEGWPTALEGEPQDNGIRFASPGRIRDTGDRIDYDTFDLDGDGIVDYVTPRENPPSYRPGNGAGFDEPRAWDWPGPAEIRRTDSHGNIAVNVLDLDGDGRPDLVDGRRASCGRGDPGTWCVWRNTGDGFAASPIEWPAPLDDLRHTDEDGGRVTVEVVDMNGDGLPDLVDGRAYDKDDPVPHWNVYWNRGDGFETTPHAFRSHRRWVGRSEGRRSVYGLWDMNGDGLPDLVAADTESIDDGDHWRGQFAWQVWLGDGRAFSEDVLRWAAEDGSLLPNFASIGVGAAGLGADLVDLNGDGLPDLVRRSTPSDELYYSGLESRCIDTGGCSLAGFSEGPSGPSWCCYNLLAWYNTGSGFAPPVAWRSQNTAVRSANEDCPFTISRCFGADVWHYDLMDFNGDGLLDQVQRDYGGWRVFLHPSSPAAGQSSIPIEERGPPNTLLAMVNGVGGATTLRWTPAAGFDNRELAFPRWVVAEQALFDGMHEEPALRTTFTYEGGLYDPIEREFRGFARVRAREESGLVRESTFHQDGRRRGLAIATRLLQASSDEETIVGIDEYDWPDSGPLLLRSHRSTPWHEGAALDVLSVLETYDYDAFGNRQVLERSTPLAAKVRVESVFEHDILDRSDGLPRRYRVDRPLGVRTFEDGRALPLLERTFTYKARPPFRGILVATASCMEWAATGACERWSEVRFEHDAWGNVARSRTPGGLWTETDYDAAGRFVAEQEQPGFGTTTALHDPRTGRVVATTSAGGNFAFSEYDGLGRLISSWGPGQTASQPALRRQFRFGDGQGRPGVATVVPRGGPPRATFHDGLGREIATKTIHRTDDGPVTMVTGRRIYDRTGSIRRESLPETAAIEDLDRLAAADETSAAWVDLVRDELGRLMEVRLPDGSATAFDRHGPGAVVRRSPSLLAGETGGNAVLTFFDGFDRRIVEEICENPPSTQSPWECPDGALRSRTLWFYDGLGRVREMHVVELDDRGRSAGRTAVTQVSYDGLGNRTELMTADGAHWRYTYDADSRLLTTERPDGGKVEQEWDAEGRLVWQTADGATTTFRYERDHPGRGKVERISTRSSGGRTVKRFSYDDRGRLTHEDWSINPRGDRGRRFTFEHRYDELDRRIATSYPTSERRGSEEIVTTFSDDGRAVALTGGDREFVVDVGQDRFGIPVRIDYGNGLRDLAGYDPPGSPGGGAGLLRCLKTGRIGAELPCDVEDGDLAGLAYSAYDADGRLLAIDDAMQSVGDRAAASRRYSYDSLGRVATALYGDGVEETFSFDSLGNPHEFAAGRLEYVDPATPHRPALLVRSNESGAAVDLLRYGASGNLLARGDLRFAYDGLDRLVEIHRGSELLERRQYDEAGHLVAVFDGRTARVRVLFGNFFEVEGGDLVRHYHLGSRHVASDAVAAPRDLAGRGDGGLVHGLRYFHPDHQGSPTLVTDQSGNVLARPRFRIGGNTATFAPSPFDANPTPGFTGHPTAPSVGLVDMGRRLYDPELGLFLTPDPQSQYPSPYILGGGNAVLGRDPDGEIFGMTALGFAALVGGTATFVDSLIETGNFGAALTAGVFAGISTYSTHSLARGVVGARAATLPGWAKGLAGIATVGVPVANLTRDLRDGRIASAIATLTILAAAATGAEQSEGPSPGSAGVEDYARQGIVLAEESGKRYVFSDGICATRPGCFTNSLRALRENLRLLFTGEVECVEGCEAILREATQSLQTGQTVHLHCHSFGAIKCLGALQQLGGFSRGKLPATLRATLTGAPILRAPSAQGLAYEANLFDPVTWIGTLYSVPFRSDVLLGRGALVPLPLVVHAPEFYLSDELQRIRAEASP